MSRITSMTFASGLCLLALPALAQTQAITLNFAGEFAGKAVRLRRQDRRHRHDEGFR
jgi:hypothetical protein